MLVEICLTCRPLLPGTIRCQYCTYISQPNYTEQSGLVLSRTMSTPTTPRRSTRSVKREPTEQPEPETTSRYFTTTKMEPDSPPAAIKSEPGASPLKVTMITHDDLKPDLIDGQGGRKRSRVTSNGSEGTSKRTRLSSTRTTRTSLKREEEVGGMRSPGSSPLTDLEELPAHLQIAHLPPHIKPDPNSLNPNTLNDDHEDEEKPKPKPKKSPAKKPTIKLKLDKPHAEPKNWERQYGLIEVMRAKIVAPVDTL